MNNFQNCKGKTILSEIVHRIKEEKDFLCTVDGLIGDGDHGANMNKGFSLFEKRYLESDISFSDGLRELGTVLLNEIGGSMGPIYGTVFMEMSDSLNGLSEIGLPEFSRALQAGLEGLYCIVDARPGDKTLVDTLAPAVAALNEAADSEKSFAEALACMKQAALEGRDATKEMTARYGRSSRLGERSRGVLDAGACSCCTILTAMAEGIVKLLLLQES